MGIIGRLYKAFNAFRGRAKLGALQGGLIFNIKNSGVDSPRAKYLASQIASTAWQIPIVSEFFQRYGFSFEDYAVMYNAAILACPNMLIENKNLVATFLLVDNFQNLAPGFLSMSKAVSGQTGKERETGLSTLITLSVNDVLKLSAERNYPQLTNIEQQ